WTTFRPTLSGQRESMKHEVTGNIAFPAYTTMVFLVFQDDLVSQVQSTGGPFSAQYTSEYMIYSPSYMMYLGAHARGIGRLSGMINEIAVYNRVLNSTERSNLLTLFNQVHLAYPSPTSTPTRTPSPSGTPSGSCTPSITASPTRSPSLT